MLRKVLIGTTVFFALVIVGLVIAISMVDLNKYKPQITQAVKDASGYDLQIAGDISASFTPVGVKISQISLAVPQQKPFTTLKEFKVALEILPLLSSKVKVNYVVLADLDLQIEKNKAGKFNFEVAKKETATSKQTPATNEGEAKKTPLINVDEVRLENFNVNYIDLGTNAKASVKDIDLVVTNISYDASKEPKKAVGFDGDLKVQKLTYGKYNINNMDIQFALQNAVAKVKSMEYTIFGSKGSGDATVDLNPKVPTVAFSQKIPDLNLVNFSKEIIEKEMFEGALNLDVNLAMSLDTPKVIQQTLTGFVLADGKGVGIKGYDLDKALGGYSKTQSVDAVDIGSFLVAGPVGFALSKSSDGAGAYSALKGGATLLKHLHVKLDFAKSKGVLSDVALATGKNRIALKGTLDMAKEGLDIKAGILDAKGCAKYSQSIAGTFTKPQVKMDESTINTVMNLANSLFGKTKKKEEPKECSVFYSGVVSHP